MHHALDVDTHVGIFDTLDALAAAMAMRKERERVASNLVEQGIVVPAGQGHWSSGSRLIAARPTLW